MLARLNNNPTAQDEAETFTWIEADPRHAIAYARAEAAWQAAERLKSAAAEVNLPPLAGTVTEEQQRRRSRNIMIVAGIALILFILVAIVMIRIFNDVDHHETRIGEIRTISLPVELTGTRGTAAASCGSRPPRQIAAGDRSIMLLYRDAQVPGDHDI